MGSELKEEVTAFFGKHGKKIALVMGAIFISLKNGKRTKNNSVDFEIK